MKSITASTIEVDATLGKAPLPGELCLQTSMRLTHQETGKKCPKFKCNPPFILLEYDIIVHLHWNAPQSHGGKVSGDADWLIIHRPCPLSTQGHTFDSEAFAMCCTCSYYTHLGTSIKLWLLNNGTHFQVTRIQASTWRLLLLRCVGINHHSNRGGHATA